jgi:hypothetical protein
MEMIMILGGISSYLSISQYMKNNNKVAEINTDQGEQMEVKTVLKESLSKINFNLGIDGNDKSISVLQKDNETTGSGNIQFSIVENTDIKLNKVSKADNHQGINRSYSLYGLNNQNNQTDNTARDKSFLKNEKDVKDYSKLSKLKKKQTIQEIDGNNNELPNIHDEKLRHSRIIY